MQAKLGDGIIVSGILPKDAEFQLTKEKQVPLCKFGLKVGERQNGDKRDAIWANCVCWRNVANAASEFCKGDTVLAWGKSQTSSYVSRDGEDKTKTELVCEFVIKMESIEDLAHKAYSAHAESGFQDLPDASDDELPL
jgi:single-stranded DNA-binding protein